jgi:hypothetical protein
MQTYIYKLSPRTKSGFITAVVYIMDKDEPVLLGTTKWRTSAYEGVKHEIIDFLENNEFIMPSLKPTGNIRLFEV